MTAHRNRDEFAIRGDAAHRQERERRLRQMPIDRPVMLITTRMAAQAVLASLVLWALIAGFLMVTP